MWSTCYRMMAGGPGVDYSNADKEYSSDSYISVTKAKELTTVLKEYHSKAALADEPSAKKKAKKLPLGDSNDVFTGGSVRMEIILKKVPLNKTTFINLIGPLPHPWKFESSDVDVCLIVKDLDPRNSLPDREVDLETTRNHYRSKLEDAGFSPEFLNQRLVILPMRELMTEFMTQEAKGKLVSAYNVFLADRCLMANKFSGLKTFLGKKFWFTHKKVPYIVDMRLEGAALKQNIIQALDSTNLYVSGRGTSQTVEIGRMSQSEVELAYNLIFVLKRVRQIFGSNVACLRLGVVTGNHDVKHFYIPFFVDMDYGRDLPKEQICPQTSALNGKNLFEVLGK